MEAGLTVTDNRTNLGSADQLPGENSTSCIESSTNCGQVPKDSGISENCEDKATLENDITEGTDVCSPFGKVRDGRTKASAEPEAPQLNELEYAEITLVVEVSADTEMTQAGVIKHEVGVQYPADDNSVMIDPELGATDDCKPGVPGTNSAASEMEENLIRAQDNVGNSSGHMHGFIISGEETSRLDLDGMSEFKTEAKVGLGPGKRRAAEGLLEQEHSQTNELTEGLLYTESEKGRIEEGVAVQLNEQVVLPILSEGCGTEVTKNTSFVEDSKTDLELGPTVKSMEQNSGSMMGQTDLVRDSINVSSGSVHKGPLKTDLGRDSNQEETEYLRRTAMTDVGVKSHGGLDLDAGLDYHSDIVVVGEGVEGGAQELSIKIDYGISYKSADKGPISSYEKMEIDGELGAKQDAIEEGHFPHRHFAGKDELNASACQVEVCQSKESVSEVNGRRDTQAMPGPFGQVSQVSLAAASTIVLPKFEDDEAACTDVLQRERKINQSAQPEMQVRVTESHHKGVQGTFERTSRELSFARSRKEEETSGSVGQHWHVGMAMKVKSEINTSLDDQEEGHKVGFANDGVEDPQEWSLPGTGYETAEHHSGACEEEKMGVSDEANTGTSEEERYFVGQHEIIENSGQKRKLSDNLGTDSCAMNEPGQSETLVKKVKKKTVNVWAKSTSRKGPKKNSRNVGSQNILTEDSVLLTPVFANPDKVEDGPDQPIVLSKYDKAEKIELSENRLAASSTKGYRMVRATRGVQEGTWYYEILVEQLGPTGHTRLGWSTQKGDVQAPVGFDSNSYGYRDLDGSKTHVAVREPYGDLYVEGDVIGFYIHLPNGTEYAPKPASLLLHRGRGPYLSDVKEEQPRQVPGSEICFFRNGVSQGTAFTNIYGGRYFPAASMYTLPKEPSCTVRFNFGPDFRYPPMDLDGRPEPMAMLHAPYHNALNGQDIGPTAHANICTTEISTPKMEPQISVL